MDAAKAKEIVSSLYEDWYSSLLAYVYRLTGKRADAEEIVQEAFMLLYRRCRKGHVIQNPQGWTLRVARRLAWKRRTQEETCWALTCAGVNGKLTHCFLPNISVWSFDHGEVGSSA